MSASIAAAPSVHVVAAGVHDADVLVEVGAAHRGLEGIVRLLGDGQPVHVRSHGDRLAGQTPLQDADDAGVSDARLYLDAELPELGGDQRAGPRLAVRKFGMPVHVLALRTAGSGMLRRQRHDLGVGRLAGGGDRPRGEQAGGGGDRRSCEAHGNPPGTVISRTAVPRCREMP
jgi:hypothetical protein